LTKNNNLSEKFGWCSLPLGSVIDKVSTNEKKIKQKEYLIEGQHPVIDQGAAFIGGYTNDASKVLQCDLPAVVFGDHTKILKLVRYPFAPGADGVKVLLPQKSILPELFVYFVQILLKKIPDKGYARHFQHIEKSEIPIPPLPEQRAIVAKIEQLFSELDNGIASLKTAQEQLKVYRQAVVIGK
jgi:type I restriction enzyme S subunit